MYTVADVLDSLPMVVREMIANSKVQFRVYPREHLVKLISQIHGQEGREERGDPHINAFYNGIHNRIFLSEERFSRGTVIHELGHAMDMHLGGGFELVRHIGSISQRTKELRYEFNKAKESLTFLNRNSSLSITEWFAEGFRAFLNADDTFLSSFPLFNGHVSRKKLKLYAPELETFFAETFDM